LTLISLPARPYRTSAGDICARRAELPLDRNAGSPAWIPGKLPLGEHDLQRMVCSKAGRGWRGNPFGESAPDLAGVHSSSHGRRCTGRGSSHPDAPGRTCCAGHGCNGDKTQPVSTQQTFDSPNELPSTRRQPQPIYCSH
jgi:hypothetical protein